MNYVRDIQVEVGRNIRGLRIEKGLNQREAAEALGGISYASLSSYETGKNDVPATILYRMAKLYGVSVDELFYEIPRIAWANKVWGVKPKLSRDSEE